MPYSRKDDFPNLCTPRQDDERCRYAEEAADRAVEKMVAKLFGVDSNDPEKVKKIQSMHNFVERLEKITEKGMLSAVATLAALMVGALMLGIKTKIMGQP